MTTAKQNTQTEGRKKKLSLLIASDWPTDAYSGSGLTLRAKTNEWLATFCTDMFEVLWTRLERIFIAA